MSQAPKKKAAAKKPAKKKKADQPKQRWSKPAAQQVRPKRGRPTVYHEDFNEQAMNMCLLGYKDAELAQYFHVEESTLNRWKDDYPKFKESIKNGREDADARVSRRLWERANGYDAPDVDIRVIDGEIVKTPLVKHYPPEPVAQIFWLKNRRPDLWRDKQDVNVNAMVSMPDVVINPYSDDTDEGKKGD